MPLITSCDAGSAGTAAPARDRRVPAALALAALLGILPVLTVAIPPLVDYPNHLARMHVLATAGSTDPVQANYAVFWRPVPNLAMDLVVPPLARVLGVVEAGRLFLVMTCLMLAGGIAALHRVAHGRLGLTPAVAVLVMASQPFGWGFLNFCASIGLALLVLAGWMASAGWRALPRLAVFNLAVAGLYLAHLFGLAAYALAVAVHEFRLAVVAGEFRPRALAARAAPALGQFALAAALYVAAWATAEGGVAPMSLGGWFGDPATKLSALGAAVLLYGGWTDALVVVSLVAAGVGLRLAGRLAVAPALRWHLLVFLVLTLAAPHVFRGLFLDSRIGFVLGCLAIAALRVEIGGKAAGLLFAGLLAVAALKQGDAVRTWHAYDGDYADFRAALDVLEPGARILAVHDLPGAKPAPGGAARWRMALPGLPAAIAYRGVVTLAVLERGAFVPDLFTLPAAQPVRSAPRNLPLDPVQPARRVTREMLLAGAGPAGAAGLAATAPTTGERVFWRDWPAHFDAVIVFRYAPDRRDNPLLSRLVPRAAGGFFDIYDVARGDPRP